MEYHNDRFIDYSLLIFKLDTLVAVLPANRDCNTLHSHQGLTYGGLVTKESIKLNDVILVFKTLLQFLEADKIANFNLKLLPSIYTKIPNNELDYLLFLMKANLYRRDITSVINCKEACKSFSKVRLRGLKRAEKHGLIIRETVDFKDFWNSILIPNLKKKYHKSPVHNLEEIEKLHRFFPKKIRQFNVYHNDVLVAGTTIFETTTVAHAQYIASTENRQELGSLDFLFYSLIQGVFREKTYFDFGISNENQGQNINEGLLYWKESFGARTITQDFYSIKTNNHGLLDNVFL